MKEEAKIIFAVGQRVEPKKNKSFLIGQDVVEVVRCKDCIHKMEDNYSDGNVPDLICREWDSGVDAYDYCSYGERKDG